MPGCQAACSAPESGVAILPRWNECATRRFWRSASRGAASRRLGHSCPGQAAPARRSGAHVLWKRERGSDQDAGGAGPGLGPDGERPRCPRIFRLTARSPSVAIRRSRPPLRVGSRMVPTHPDRSRRIPVCVIADLRFRVGIRRTAVGSVGVGRDYASVALPLSYPGVWF